MTISSDYEIAKRHYKQLVAHHKADPSDITGAFNEGDHYMLLLDNPCKKVACDHFIKLIEHTASSGFEHGYGQGNSSFQPDLDNDDICDIYRYYNFEDRILTRWGIDIDNGL